VAEILVARYACREREGGCGAKLGEQCKTYVHGKLTQPHEDRWRQWRMRGSPGGWWAAGGERPGVAELIEQAERLLAEAGECLGKLKAALEEAGR
jgi:hypothetical protein